MRASDPNGDPVELRLVNTRTSRRVPDDKIRIVPTDRGTDPRYGAASG
jgi:hypothetical protein